MTATRRVTPASERFWSRVNKTPTCWLWTAGLNSVGYGRLRVDGRLEYAHRYSYRVHIGPIDDKDQVDHLCHVRHCVNPDHLRAVSPSINQRNRKGANRNSASGVRGVSWSEKHQRWLARANVAGYPKHLGQFVKLEDAERTVIEFLRSLPGYVEPLHDKGEPCRYGWSDVHFHRCVPPQAAQDESATEGDAA